jgi:methionine aminopeptidase
MPTRIAILRASHLVDGESNKAIRVGIEDPKTGPESRAIGYFIGVRFHSHQYVTVTFLFKNFASIFKTRFSARFTILRASHLVDGESNKAIRVGIEDPKTGPESRAVRLAINKVARAKYCECFPALRETVFHDYLVCPGVWASRIPRLVRSLGLLAILSLGRMQGGGLLRTLYILICCYTGYFIGVRFHSHQYVTVTFLFKNFASIFKTRFSASHLPASSLEIV